MVNKISAPYNFVPLNEFVFVPDWAAKCRKTFLSLMVKTGI